MTESIYLIYKHTSPSGKSYIGLTKNYDARCKQHRYTASRCIAFQAAIAKHGWDNFTHDILVEGITLDEANVLEARYIDEHQSLHPNGYNLTPGGKVYKISDDTRDKISSTAKGKPKSATHKAALSAVRKGRPGRAQTDATKAKIAEASKGKTITDEHKAKISAAQKGKVVSDETRAKMSASKIGTHNAKKPG